MRWSERESGTPQSPDTVKAIPCKYSVVIYKICTKVCFFLSITTVFFFLSFGIITKKCSKPLKKTLRFHRYRQKEKFQCYSYCSWKTSFYSHKLGFIAIQKTFPPPEVRRQQQASASQEVKNVPEHLAVTLNQ